jgi:hypothetical protein
MPSSVPIPDSRSPYVLLNDQPAIGKEADCLDTPETARKLVDVLLSSRKSSPFVLAVNGEWGIGKSTLLQEMSSQLTAARNPQRNNEANGINIRCVQFNAWTAENSSVLENLIAAVLTELDPNFVRRWANKLARRRGLLSALRIGFAIAAGFFGLSRAVNDLMTSFSISARSRSEMRELIQEVLGDWLKSGGQGTDESALVVFVDDIDRCSDETVVQMCEAIKLYLDMPGLIFVLACDLTILARGVTSVTGATRSEAFAYLEKIIQVAYRVPTPDDRQIAKLISQCSLFSGTDELFDGANPASKILAEGTRRNPRRIKRIINSFILEYTLDPAWATPQLGIESLIKSVLLYLLYPWFYDVFIGDYSSDDPIQDFLDYIDLENNQFDSDGDRLEHAEKVFKAYQLSMQGENLAGALKQLRSVMPKALPALTHDQALISLLKSMGDADSRRAIRAQLIHSPLRSERRLALGTIWGSSQLSGASLQAGQALNAGTDHLQALVMQTELAAATEAAQYQELQIESDANNAAASSVAQAAQHKMQTNSKIFQGFDEVISG